MTRPVLATARARVELLPQVGGSIGRFVVDGRDVLRRAPEGTTDALDVGCFPLVPFCNRIPNGRFSFEGRDVVLAPNLAGHPHALHGQGWRAAWTVTGLSDTRAVLTYDHAPSDWPWAYRAEQIFVLSDEGLRVELSVTNTGTEVMPAGLGLHPYFAARPGETLTLDADGVWMVDADVLPTVRHDIAKDGPWMRDWAAGALAATDTLIDNCWTGFGGKAVLSAPGGASTVIEASDNCHWAHVYSPPGADFVCVEPTASRPDPFGEGETGIVALAPGEKTAVWMTLKIA
ncbi:aldose 1-epimerase [Caulobacter hibisci]|uniref:Aldose 1-epimerase n=1 Tax=Caulobacter hibisci TaxID=2035993 RepID=A0ABS0SSE5_9CAUL|nr:aldose 1-epimerase [Caulobacter hibisci]MBI1682096.1 aldose 1-epimerase [Caulobacter hibisci]